VLRHATAFEAALFYRALNWAVFPCGWQGETRRRPLTDHGFYDSSRDEAQIREWWDRWSAALIGVPTGRASGFIVLDVDRKNGVDGFDALEELGIAILPATPMVHSPSGGLHVHFNPGAREIRCSAGRLGRGLDVRGEGGYIIMPSPNSGYWWDPIWNVSTVGLAAEPISLLPREGEHEAAAAPIRPAVGLSPYAEAALEDACRRIIAAPAGEQEMTLNREAFATGTLAGAGAIPIDFARPVLVCAASRIPTYDPRRPWRPGEIERKVEHAFNDGLRHPRGARRG
jgi:hypothetical protein